MELPSCGIYKTTEAIGSVPAGQLVYFHNHGDPGPGVYLPESWATNRAKFSKKGTTLPDDKLAFTLEPLKSEGLYQTIDEITCCSKECRTYPKGLLVQLGYNGKAEPILFLPEWSESGLAFPQMGNKLDLNRLEKLAPLKVATPKRAEPDDPMVH